MAILLSSVPSQFVTAEAAADGEENGEKHEHIISPSAAISNADEEET